MPQSVSKMVQVSNLYLQRGAAKILNKALLKFDCKPLCEQIFFKNLSLVVGINTVLEERRLMSSLHETDCK